MEEKTSVVEVKSNSLLDDPLGYLFEVRGAQKVFVLEGDPHKAIEKLKDAGFDWWVNRELKSISVII